jgi:hypothetical protein
MKTVTAQAGSATSATTYSKAPLVRRASAVAITLAATAVVLLLSAGAASAQIQNPIDGVKPDLSVFGPAFNNVWVRVIGGSIAFGCLASVGIITGAILFVVGG